jgi:hypothetical protein
MLCASWRSCGARRRAPPSDCRARSSAFVQSLRGQDLFKLPGVAETIDWTRSLMELDRICLDPETINDTLGVLLKYQDDIARLQGGEIVRLLDELRVQGALPA